MALVRTKAVHVRKFIWEHIICRFGVPAMIISDNGKQFDCDTIKSLCEVLHIKHNFSTPYYVQSNGQAEETNRVILENLKKTLDKSKGRWTEFLHGVLWAYRTTPRRSTGFAPFTLAYGTEAVLPVELLVPTTKTLAERSGLNSEILSKDKEMLEEVRDEASRRLAIYQQSMKQQYNKKVREQTFLPGEQVLRRTRPKSLDGGSGKLGENLEGPFLVDRPASGGAYWLSNMNGREEPKPWNSFNLKKYFH